MSDCYINIRFFWWHLKFTFDKKISITKNNYWKENNRWKIIPFEVYDFDLKGLFKK